MLQNVDIKVEGQKLIITVDLTKELGPSASKKTTIIATTGGSYSVGGGAILGLNVYKKAGT
jgi:hypothetical protein